MEKLEALLSELKEKSEPKKFFFVMIIVNTVFLFVVMMLGFRYRSTHPTS